MRLRHFLYCVSQLSPYGRFYLVFTEPQRYEAARWHITAMAAGTAAAVSGAGRDCGSPNSEAARR